MLPLLLSLALLVANCAAQTSITTNEVTATSIGNLVLGGYTVIGTDSSGIASHSTSTETGALYTLNPSGAVYSPFVSDATCTFVAFSSNYSTVDAFVVTKSNFQTMLSGGKLDYSKAQPLPAGNWKALRSASAVLATNTTDSYVFVVINTGGQSQNGSLNSPTQVGFRIAAYDKTSTVCPGSDNGGFPTSNESVRTNPRLVPYFEENTNLAFKETRPFAVIDSATCISFQVLAQVSQSISSLDLLFFVDVITSSESWITSKFPLPVPHLGAMCQQSLSGVAGTAAFVGVNSTAASAAGVNATISASQYCQVNVDGLDPTSQYVIWGINGESSASGGASDAFLRYTARGQGSCAGVAFPDPSTGIYLGSPTNVVFAINTPASPTSPPSGGSPPVGGNSPSPPTGPSTPGVSSPPPAGAPPSPGAGSGGSGGPGGAGGANGGGAGGCGGAGGAGGNGTNAGNGGSGGPGGAGGNNLGGGSGGCGGQGGGGGAGSPNGGKGGNGGSGGPGGAAGAGPAGAGGGAGGGGGGAGSALNNATGSGGNGGSGGPGGAGGSNNGGSGGSGGGGGAGGNALSTAPAGNGGSGGVGGAGGPGSPTAAGGNGGPAGPGGNGGNSTGNSPGGNGGSGGPGGAGGAAGAAPGGPGGAGGAAAKASGGLALGAG